MPKASLAFAGCRLNRYEIQSISESLELRGFEIVPFGQPADLYVINTCGVTAKAEASSRQLVRRARRVRPDSKIVVTGCYSQLKSGEMENLGADLVVPNMEKENIDRLVGNLPGLDIGPMEEQRKCEFGAKLISSMGDLTRSFTKIQEGCDRKCTYCTIRITRGPVRSRRAEFIVREISNLCSEGYRETVLTGVHIGLYFHRGMTLSGLIRLILAETDMPRIRLSSLHPSEIDDDLIDLLSSNARLCPHVHLSIQSGDDSILQAMGRRYTGSDLVQTIDRLNSSIPRVTVGADIITGFPGEGEAEFRNTKSLMEDGGVHHLHVFTFSPRPGTPAASMSAQVPFAIRKYRTRELRALGRRLESEHLRKFLGQELSVLFEKGPPEQRGLLMGLSENFLRVESRGENDMKGEIFRVRPYGINGGILLSDIELA